MQSALPTRPTPPPTQKPVDGGDHRHAALVDRPEGGEAAPVGADQGVEALGVLHLLDVDAGVEALALGAQHDHVGGQVLLASSSASATSYHPWTGSAFTGGKSIVTTRTPSSWSTDVTPMGPSVIELSQINQAFAWYSTRVSISVDLSGRVALVTGGSQGIGAGIAAVLVEAGATVVTCARSAVETPRPGPPTCSATCATPRRSRRWSTASSPSTAGSTSWSTTRAGRRTPWPRTPRRGSSTRSSAST